MSAAGIRALVNEARKVGAEVTAEAEPASVGSVAVSGMLAEQLAKELGAGARPGAVEVGTEKLRAGVEGLVHVIAGDPSADDEEIVRAAAEVEVPVVLVQLWPQQDWTKPFVLSPFVIECRPGEGFPICEIAERLAEATGDSAALAADLPAISDLARAGLVRQAVMRSAVIGFAGARMGASRPLISLEQARMVARLRRTSVDASPEGDRTGLVAGGAAALLAGFAFRRLARELRWYVPEPVANTAVAAAGTWALAKAFDLAAPYLPKR